MMTKTEIRAMRERKEAEARTAAAQGKRDLWLYLCGQINVIDRILEDGTYDAEDRIPFTPLAASSPPPRNQ